MIRASQVAKGAALVVLGAVGFSVATGVELVGASGASRGVAPPFARVVERTSEMGPGSLSVRCPSGWAAVGGGGSVGSSHWITIESAPLTEGGRPVGWEMTVERTTRFRLATFTATTSKALAKPFEHTHQINFLGSGLIQMVVASKDTTKVSVGVICMGTLPVTTTPGGAPTTPSGGVTTTRTTKTP